jgi:hypothetical protein
MASHPKRSRITSTARSAIQRAMPIFVPGRLLIVKPKGEIQLHARALFKTRHRDRQQRNRLFVRIVREDCAYQLLCDFSKDRSRRNRCIERDRACDRVEIGEANADRLRFGQAEICLAVGRRPCPRDDAAWVAALALPQAACRVLIGRRLNARDGASGSLVDRGSTPAPTASRLPRDPAVARVTVQASGQAARSYAR